MSTIWISIALGIASAIFGAITSILAKKVMTFTSSRNYLSLNFAFLFLFLLPFSPLFFKVSHLSITMPIIIVTAAIDCLANYTYFKSFEINDTVTASSILSLSPLFTLALLPVFNHNSSPVSAVQILGILSMVGGVYLLNREMTQKKDSKTQINLSGKQWLVPVLTAFLFGANIHVMKYLFSNQMTNPATYYLIRAFLIAIFTFFAIRPDTSWMNRKTVSFTGFRALFVLIQWLLLLYSLDLGNPAIVKTISDSSPLFVIPVAVFFMHEKMTTTKTLGVILILMGLAMITI